MPLHALTLTELLDRVAASEPTPGGGSVAAIAGAFGAALAQMVAGLPKTRHATDDERAVLASLHAPLADLRERLVELADEDTAAFDRLMAAFRLSKSSDEEKTVRRAAIQTATRDATTVPLQTAMACARVLDLVGTVAALGNRSASSDLLVAMGLLRAAAEGAAANVRTNLEGIVDETFTADATARITAVLDEVTTHMHAATAALQG
jgi:formiminotetrahydrofolate cyclodeaminase